MLLLLLQVYQKLIQEFKDAFPTTISSPKQVSEKLITLQNENKKLYNTIETLKIQHKIELDSISSSIDSQVKIYRDNIIQERKQHKVKVDNLLSDYNHILTREKDDIHKHKHELDIQYNQHINTIQQEYNTKLSNISSEIYKLQADLSDANIRIQDYEDEILQKDAQMHVLSKKLDKLEEEDLMSLDKSSIGSGSLYLRGGETDDDDDRSVDSAMSSVASSTAGGGSVAAGTDTNQPTSTTDATTPPAGEGTGGDSTGQVNVVHQGIKSRSKSGRSRRHGSSSKRGKEQAGKYLRMARLLKKVSIAHILVIVIIYFTHSVHIQHIYIRCIVYASYHLNIITSICLHVRLSPYRSSTSARPKN